MRRAIALLVGLIAALWWGPALAAPPSAAPALAISAWVSANTDMPAAQVAIAGPDIVYGVEPLGPRLPTGEVLALVRTEVVSPEWRAAHQVQSWDAHLLFDCGGGRVRMLRSASYSAPNRGGVAKSDERGDAWFSPDAQAPVAKLLAAACDAKFAWPLRGAVGPSVAAPAAPPAIPASTAPQAAPAQPPAPRSRAPETQKVAQAEPTARAATTQLAAAAPQPLVAVGPATPALQKASFTLPSVLQPPAALQAPDEQAHPRLLATAATATRTCKRLAGEVRAWVWRRVDVASTRHGERTTPQGAPATPAAVTT
jgi:hypothetical protein